MKLDSRVIGKLAITFCVFVSVHRSFVEPAPAATGNYGDNVTVPKADLDDVKQLEDLKQSLGASFAVVKAHTAVHYENSDGQQGSHTENKEETLSDGKLVSRLVQDLHSVRDGNNATPVATLHVEVDVPSRGVHKVVDEPLEHGQREVPFNFERRSDPDLANQIDSRFATAADMPYSPRDMAEYVFWTGDEKGVTLAIEEFLADGLMTLEEAISFLQDIKLNLDYLQLHYSSQRRFQKPEDQDFINLVGKEKSFGVVNKPSMEEVNYNLPYDTQKRADALINQDEPQSSALGVGMSEEDYDELLERLRVADFLYTEYSLEEVIYQLAKVMFSQSLSKGSTEAQEALQKFTTFLEAEAENGRISKSLEKKVLDVLIASLSDTLTEHPQLLPTAQESLKESSTASANQLLHQLIMLNPATAGGDIGSNVKAKTNKLRSGTSEGHQSTLAKARETMIEAKTNTNNPVKAN